MTLLVWALVGLCVSPFVLQEQELSQREQQQLVEAWFEVDATTEEGRAEQARILDALSNVPPLSASAIKSWQKRITKLWKKGRELEPKSGDHWFWEDEKRGRYIVQGKTKRPKGLFLGMHGGGVGSGDAGGSAGAFGHAASAFDWVGVFPEVLEKTEHGWTTSGTEEFVLALVDAAIRTWNIDPDHVVFGGHSMGGFGSWVLGAHHADRVAALVPSAGAPSPVYNAQDEVVDLMEGVIPNLRNVPMLIFQSADDPQVPPGPNRFAAKALVEARERWGGFANQEYWEVDGVGHGFPPGGTKVLLEKVSDYVRDPHPAKIVWQPSLSWKRQFYWLHWDKPLRHAVIVAEVDPEANSIRVESDKPTFGLSVLLSDAIVDMKREVVVTLVEKEGEEREVFRGLAEPRLEVLLLTGASGDPGRTYVARVPLRP